MAILPITLDETPQNDEAVNDESERVRFVAAIQEGEHAIAMGKVLSVDEAFAKIRARHAGIFANSEE